MSRIGKLPVAIPAGVTITIDQEAITVKGPKGELMVPHLSDVTVTQDDGALKVERHNDERIAKAQHGLQRSLLNNAVDGVTKGFEKKQAIEMALGFSHLVAYTAPEGITLTVNKMEITVAGIDKQKVGQVAAEIRALKKPEPYKGKGIKYVDEVILRKAGKAGK